MQEKILIVEDNPQSMKVATMTLRPHGYILLQATDGEEALELAVRDRPDLIIMDLQLPKLDGLEATRRLRLMPSLGSIPIVAVTAYAMKGDEEKVFKAGCDAYLPKPVNTRELARVVAELLNRKQASASYKGECQWVEKYLW
jgi:two-component system cell cycle response regulator DivK